MNNSTADQRLLASYIMQYHMEYPITNLSLADLYDYELIILIIYGLMIVFSFIANLLAMVIFAFGRNSRSVLSPFLFNLSLFNIIMTVYCVPFTVISVIFQRWIFPLALCKVLDGFKMFSVTGVLLTLIAIAIDRFCAVRYPLVMKVQSAYKRNIIALVLIWILSIIIAILWSPARSHIIKQRRLWVDSRSLYDAYLDSLDKEADPERSDDLLSQISVRLVVTSQCIPDKQERTIEIKRSIINSLQTYFIPVLILASVYSYIVAKLWQRSLSNDRMKGLTTNSLIHHSRTFKKKLKQGIKMLFTVVILHAILWLPMNIFQLCANILCHPTTTFENFCTERKLTQLLYIGAHFLTVSNTAINPIIYGFANHRFRNDVKAMKQRLCRCSCFKPIFFRRSLMTQSTLETSSRPGREKRLTSPVIATSLRITTRRAVTSPSVRPVDNMIREEKSDEEAKVSSV